MNGRAGMAMTEGESKSRSTGKSKRKKKCVMRRLPEMG
jgi:hypothetical protein